MSARFGYVRVVARPIGEAPEWVGNAWIGMQLPLAAGKIVTMRSISVLSAPLSGLGQLWMLMFGRTRKLTGFLVESHVAIVALEKENSAAAEWWRVNTPQLLKRRRYLLFDAASGEMLNDGT